MYMSDTTYIDYVTPAVNAEWLNEINDHVVWYSQSQEQQYMMLLLLRIHQQELLLHPTVQMALNELDTEKATVSSVNEKVSSTTLAASVEVL